MTTGNRMAGEAAGWARLGSARSGRAALVLLACCAVQNGRGAMALENPPERLFEQVEREVREAPTDAETLNARFDLLVSLARMLVAASGPAKVDEVFSPRKFDALMELLKRRDLGRAAKAADEALLGLSRVGKESSLAGIRKVSFPSLGGVRVVGYLFAPDKPSRCGFVFSHGGFGRKENWADVMSEAAKKANVYALAIDQQGCAESEGYTRWEGRIKDTSAAIDYLQKEFGLSRFAAGGHSGGGAYPAACAAVEDRRISSLILWDCPFDFYDMHITTAASDPGGNPAALVERTYRDSLTMGLPVTSPEVMPFRGVGDRLDDMYGELERTLKRYRGLPAMLGKAQKERDLAVLHIVAEDVLRPVRGTPLGETYSLPPAKGASKARAAFLGRPLPFYASGLFNRPAGMWKRWESELGEPKRTAVIENTTHGFERPGRDQALRETLEWLGKLDCAVPAAPK